MKFEQIEELFEKHQGQRNLFNLIEEKHSMRREIHALVVLDRLFPDGDKIISYYDGGVLTLNFDEERLNKLNESQIIELIRCGVELDDIGMAMYSGCTLSMMVVE